MPEKVADHEGEAEVDQRRRSPLELIGPSRRPAPLPTTQRLAHDRKLRKCRLEIFHHLGYRACLRSGVVVGRSLHNANRDAVIDGCTISI